MTSASVLQSGGSSVWFSNNCPVSPEDLTCFQRGLHTFPSREIEWEWEMFVGGFIQALIRSVCDHFVNCPGELFHPFIQNPFVVVMSPCFHRASRQRLLTCGTHWSASKCVEFVVLSHSGCRQHLRLISLAGHTLTWFGSTESYEPTSLL